METLVKIQNELKVPKGNLNKFGNYKYRSGEDILEAVKPILLKYEATLILSDEIVSIGNKIFLKAIAKLGLNEKALNKEIINRYCIETNGYAELAEHKGMSAEQATGTASSYARKYALNGLFLIDETEADADSQQTPVIKTPAPLMPSEIIWLTEEQFNAAMKSDKKGILATLSTFNGMKGKKMKAEYLKQLTEQLNLAK